MTVVATTNDAPAIAAAAEARTENAADRRAVLLIAAMLLASCVVNGTTRQAEALRARSPVTWQEIWLLEATSHLAILLLLPLLPRILDRFPIPTAAWGRTVPGQLAGLLAFSGLHVAAMFVLRRTLFETLVGFPYPLNLFAPAAFLYELRKDSLTYAMLLVAFVLMRSIGGRRAQAAALQDARRDHKLTLRSGGSAFVVTAAEVLWARAAANYVEVVTAGRTYLARMTLGQLEALLIAAGGRHLRVHRSHLVNLDALREVHPTGEGDVRLLLSDGTLVPGSRRYRQRLLLALEGAGPKDPRADPAGPGVA